MLNLTEDFTCSNKIMQLTYFMTLNIAVRFLKLPQCGISLRQVHSNSNGHPIEF